MVEEHFDALVPHALRVLDYEIKPKLKQEATHALVEEAQASHTPLLT